MAAGTWTTQNKVRPGAYINFNTVPKAVGTVGDRGIVTMPVQMSWGESGKIITIEAGEDLFTKLGYAITDTKLLLINEALKRANKILLYRLNTGVKASATSESLTITARYGGVRGNDITVKISVNVDNASKFDVTTLLSGSVVDVQTVENMSELKGNDWVVFSGTGTLTVTAGIPLISGADGSITNQNYVDYLAAVEIFDFNTMALPVTDNILKSTAVSFCKRLREDEGKKIQIVVENYPTADYEGAISVKNGVILSDGSTLTPAQTVAWVAGATAAAQINESLTYSAYDGAVDVAPKYTNSQIIAALRTYLLQRTIRQLWSRISIPLPA